MNKKISTILLCSLVSCASITLPNVQDELKRDTTKDPINITQELERSGRTTFQKVLYKLGIFVTTIVGIYVGGTIIKNNGRPLRTGGVVLGGIGGAAGGYALFKERHDPIHDEIRKANKLMESEFVDQETLTIIQTSKTAQELSRRLETHYSRSYGPPLDAARKDLKKMRSICANAHRQYALILSNPKISSESKQKCEHNINITDLLRQSIEGALETLKPKPQQS